MKKTEINFDDMPSGWKDLNPAEGLSEDHAVILFPSEARKICQLMKEMYEALEYMSKDDVVEGHICDPNFEVVRPILDKFKAWK